MDQETLFIILKPDAVKPAGPCKVDEVIHCIRHRIREQFDMDVTDPGFQNSRI